MNRFLSFVSVRILILTGIIGVGCWCQAQDDSTNWDVLNAKKKDANGQAAVANKLRGTDGQRVGKPGETAEQRDARMMWWRDAHFGMFIHWGLYSQAAGWWNGKQVPNGGAEWIQSVAKIKGEDYAKLAKDFKAEQFNADAWVKLAKDAGMKYIVITAKHHDGFAMFDSKASDYNIVKMTPFGRDPIKELAEACRKEGLKFGLYYSQNLDWNDPYARGNEWEFTRSGADFPRYMQEKALPQIRELLTNYGDICEFWFDFPMFATQQESDQFTKLCWELQPNIILNDRAGGKSGDFCTPEQSMPGDGAASDIEACMTLNETWGYRDYDHDWKPAYNLIRNLINTTSKGGNFLLNVGPKGDGEIPQETVTRLEAVGQWMKVNSDSVYGTTSAGLGQMPWGRLTYKPGKLFMHVYEWPAGGELRVPIRNAGVTAKILSAPDAKPEVKNGDGELVISGLPKEMPDKNDTVIELSFNGDLQRGVFRGQRLLCGDFEDEYPEGWSTFRAHDFVTGQDALAGERSLRLKGMNNKDNQQIFQTVHINPGDKLSLQALVKTINCNDVEPSVELEFYDLQGKPLGLFKNEQSLTGSQGPLTVKINAVAPDKAESAVVRMRLKKIADKVNGEQSFIGDNFTLDCTPAK